MVSFFRIRKWYNFWSSCPYTYTTLLYGTDEDILSAFLSSPCPWYAVLYPIAYNCAQVEICSSTLWKWVLRRFAMSCDVVATSQIRRMPSYPAVSPKKCNISSFSQNMRCDTKPHHHGEHKMSSSESYSSIARTINAFRARDIRTTNVIVVHFLIRTDAPEVYTVLRYQENVTIFIPWKFARCLTFYRV